MPRSIRPRARWFLAGMAALALPPAAAQDAANGAMLMTLRVASGAVASSGGYARGFDLDGVHHSHILDPRTGKPCDGVLGASVVAKDTATADALATILCVLGPTEGLRLIEGMPGTEAVLVTADGKVHASKGLHALVVETTPEAAQANSNWPKATDPDTVGAQREAFYKAVQAAVDAEAKPAA